MATVERNGIMDVGIVGANVSDLELAPLLAVDAPTPGATFAVGTRVGGHGWALAATPIAEIAVLLDGQFVCHATRSRPRPDLVHAYSQYPQPGHAGFVFEFELGRVAGERAVLLFRLRTVDGHRQEIELPIGVVAAGDAPAAREALRMGDAPPESGPVWQPPPRVTEDRECEAIRLCIDAPDVNSSGGAVPVRGSLSIQGWALARTGIAAVNVAVDGVDLGPAYYGIRREDVAAAYPDWPNPLLCGFGVSIPLKALKPGRRRVRVRAVDAAQQSRSCEFEIDVETSLLVPPQESLRTVMNLAEIRLGHAVLAACGCRPEFVLLLDVSSGSKQQERARATLASLAAQTYERFHVWVHGSHERVALLAGIEIPQGRVSFLERDEILAARLELDDTTVRFIGALQAGDLLGCDALLEIALASALEPEADFLYSDERRLDRASGTVKAWLKPEWSEDLLLSSNYIGRSWFARAHLVRPSQITGLLGVRASEYELVLHLTQAARHILHVPKLLCQTQAAEASIAQDELDSLQRVVLARGIAGEVSPGGPAGVYRLQRALLQPGLVSIIIPTCGSRSLVKRCIESLRRHTTYVNFEIVCVENTPADRADIAQWLAQHADQVIRAEDSFNWSRFNNLGAARVSPDSEYLLFLNDDMEVIEPHWLNALLEHAQRPEVGVVGPLLLYPDGSIQHASLFMPELGHARHAFRFAQADDPGPFGLTLTQREVLAVTGACMLVRRSAFVEMGGFDEAHAIVNNDLDFCLRSHARGLKVVFTPYSRLLHHEMGSRSSNNDFYDVAHFEHTWRARFGGGDPYYNPKLTHESCDFSVDPEPLVAVYGAGGALGEPARVRAILAIKLDHIGDFITAFPALRRLKACFPQAKLCVLASSASARLARLEPAIDEVIEFNFFNERSDRGKLELSAQDLQALQARLRDYRFDLAIDLRKHLDTRDLLKYAGARLTAGYEREGGFPWLDVAIEWEGDAPLFPKRHHVAEDLLRLVDALAARVTGEPAMSAGPMGRPCEEAPPEFGFPSRVLFSRPVVAIHAASGNGLRQWPVEHFARLVDSILAHYPVNVALIGVSSERETTRAVLRRIGSRERVYSLAGLVRLEDLPKLLRRCVLFVGNNSGPQHIAAALGVPTVGLHSGVVDAVEWAPVGPAAIALRREMTCSPCYFASPEQCHRKAACLTGLRPEEVLRLCRRMLLLSGLRPSPSTMSGIGVDQPGQ